MNAPARRPVRSASSPAWAPASLAAVRPARRVLERRSGDQRQRLRRPGHRSTRSTLVAPDKRPTPGRAAGHDARRRAARPGRLRQRRRDQHLGILVPAVQRRGARPAAGLAASCALTASSSSGVDLREQPDETGAAAFQRTFAHHLPAASSTPRHASCSQLQGTCHRDADPDHVVLDRAGPARPPASRARPTPARCVDLVDDVLAGRTRRRDRLLAATDSFGQTALDGSLPLALPVALLAGLVSFPSPCVLPLVPGYLGYVTGLTGVDLEQQRRGRMLAGRRAVRRSASPPSSSRSAFAAGAARRGRCRSTASAVARVLGVVTIAAGPGLRRRRCRAGRRAAAASAPGRGPGRRTAARRRVRARLDAVHRADARPPCWRSPAIGGDRRPRARCSRPPTASGSACRSCWPPWPTRRALGRVRGRPPAPAAVQPVGGAAPRRRRRPAGHRRLGPPDDDLQGAIAGSTRCLMADLISTTDRRRQAERPTARARRRTHAAAARRRRAAALGLAPADEHAHRAVPAAAARRGGGARLGASRSAASTPAQVAAVPATQHPLRGPWLDRLGVFDVYSLGLVLRDLPAAVRLAGRLRPAAHAGAPGARCAPRRRGPRAGSTGCRRTRASRSTATGAEAVDAPRGDGCCAGGATGSHVHDGRRRRQRRARLPARDRQPGLPPVPARAAGRRRGRAPVGLARRRDRRRWAPRSQRRRRRTTPSTSGPGSTPSDLPPFSLHVDSMTCTFETSGPSSQLGAPREFRRRRDQPRHARRTRRAGHDQRQPPAGRRRRQGLPARQRLRAGRSPCATAPARSSTPTRRRSCRRTATTSRSASSRPPAPQPQQLGLTGFFLPTAGIDARRARARSSRTLSNPALALTAYVGRPRPATGAPQSVYTLDTDGMRQLTQRGRRAAAPAASARPDRAAARTARAR